MSNCELNRLNNERHKLAFERHLKCECGISSLIDDINREEQFYNPEMKDLLLRVKQYIED